MLSKISWVIAILVVTISLFFQNDASNSFKYNVLSYIGSFNKKDFEKTTYYKFKVPKEWVLTNEKKDYKTFVGPIWNSSNIATYINAFTNYDTFEDYVHWFDTSSCQQVDEVVSIFNKAKLLPSQNIIDIPSEIIFCNKHADKGHSYIAYLSHGAITYILVEPYDPKYKEKYIKLFKNIDYIIDEKKTPEWAK